MATSTRRRNLIRRRRSADEGEEEDEDMVNESLSDDSHLTDDDLADDSDSTEAEGTNTANANVQIQEAKANQRRKSRRSNKKARKARKDQTNDSLPSFDQTADTEAMMNGLKISEDAMTAQTIEFDDNPSPIDTPEPSIPKNTIAKGPPNSKADKKEKLSKSKRNAAGVGNEEKSLKPAVTTSKSSAQESSASTPQTSFNSNSARAGRGRGGGRFGDPSIAGVNSRWDHDLHDTVTDQAPFSENQIHNADINRFSDQPPVVAKAEINMNRTIAIGTVTVRVLLPSMEKPILFEKMPVKQFTRLPDLRPPLRRDKPVRISLPEKLPRYIFPSPERSFIFIPRAQRPNQVNRNRGRGYHSQYGSRRTSVYGGSNQSPSIGLSRRSSIARSAVLSPAASTFSRAPPYGGPPSRPVVKLPAHSFDGSTTAYPLPGQPAFRENNAGQIPMHQPRPQKTISMTGIEAPKHGPFQVHQQQDQQPFHHQVPSTVSTYYPAGTTPNTGVPPHSRHTSGPDIQPPTGGTPLSNIPERAVNAIPFQPAAYMSPQHHYTMQPPMYYYGQPEIQQSYYGASPMMYGQAGYYMPMMMAPATSAQTGQSHQEQRVNGQQQAQDPHNPLVAHESHGMVYYYPSQYVGNDGYQNGAGNNTGTGSEGYFYGGVGPQQPTVYYPS